MSTAFHGMFTGGRYALSQPLENVLLDSFTAYCDENDQQDLLIVNLKPFFEQYLHVSEKLLAFIQPHQFILKGTTEVVDFEHYLYQGGLLLILNKNLEIIEHNWKLVFSALGRKPNTSEKLRLPDIEKLAALLNQNTPQTTIADMLTVQGDKQYIDFWDFALILGRVGELSTKWD